MLAAAARFKGFLAPALVLLVGVAISWFFLVGKPKPEARPIREPVAQGVEVLRTKPGTHALTVTTQGSIAPRREIDLVAQVAGTVQAVTGDFAAGGFVATGETLVQIEQDDYEIALVRAKATVADAEQNLATIKGQARQAKREWRDVGNAEANALFLKKPQIASAQAQLAAAEADLRKARLDLQRTSIGAPFAGRIRETFVDIGQYVTPGTPVARLYATDVVEVRLPLTDRQVALLALPLASRAKNAAVKVPVTLTGVFGGRAWQWQAYVTRTDASIDLQTRIIYAVAEVPEPYAEQADSERPPLAIGQFVEAELSGKSLDDVLLLPRAALRPGDVIWLAEDDKLQIAAVQILQMNNRQVAVHGDFDVAVDVIVSPLALAVAGMPIAPTPADAEVFAQDSKRAAKAAESSM